jgi:hypothetical protein
MNEPYCWRGGGGSVSMRDLDRQEGEKASGLLCICQDG